MGNLLLYQAIEDLLGFASGLDDTGLAQHGELLRERRLVDAELVLNLADRSR